MNRIVLALAGLLVVGPVSAQQDDAAESATWTPPPLPPRRPADLRVVPVPPPPSVPSVSAGQEPPAVVQMPLAPPIAAPPAIVAPAPASRQQMPEVPPSIVFAPPSVTASAFVPVATMPSEAVRPAPAAARPEAAPPSRSRNVEQLPESAGILAGLASSVRDVRDRAAGAVVSLWSGSGSDTRDRHDELIVEAMAAAGFDLVHVVQEGYWMASEVFVFESRREPTAAERATARRLSAELDAFGGLRVRVEKEALRQALETRGEAVQLRRIEIQTAPYPWMKTVSGPFPAEAVKPR